MRFLIAYDDSVYETVRASLDAAWELPNAAGTVTCLTPAASAVRGSDSKILIAVRDEFCTWEPAATMLPQLLASGVVSEITAEQYAAAIRKEGP